VLCNGSKYCLDMVVPSKARLTAETVVNSASALSLVVYGFRISFPPQTLLGSVRHGFSVNVHCSRPQQRGSPVIECPVTWMGIRYD
jgi:hypothetical protein